jgi:hypothetical protein
MITLRREYREALDTLLALLETELRIFDPDLADLGLDAPDRARLLKAFLRRSPSARIYIALHSTEHLTRRAPRLMALVATFGGKMFVNKTEGDAARVQDCFLLCDALHFVRRPVSAQPRGALYLHDPRAAQEMRERFEAIWTSSVPAVSGTPAGL